MVSCMRADKTNDNYLVTGRVKLESSSTFTINDPDEYYTGTAGSGHCRTGSNDFSNEA